MEGNPSWDEARGAFSRISNLRSPTSVLVLALQNEIGERGQRLRIFRVAMAIEASLGPPRIVLGQAAHALERAGVVHQGNDRLRPHGVKLFFRNDSSYESAGLQIIVFYRLNEQPPYVAFFQRVHISL